MGKTDTDNTTPNRKYKDSVFTALFNSKESLLELYKVLHPEDTEVTIYDIGKITLENVILIRRYNDAAMGVRDKLVILSEHQSTPNPNMPVRLLLYIAEELKHTPGYTFTDALKETVQWCRQENILAGFMKERSEELMSLMLEEWNMEDAIKYNREDAWEEGMEKGVKNGMVYAYYEMNLKTNEIARKVNLTEEEVLEIIKNKNKQQEK